MRHITLIVAVLALAVAAPAIAGKGGNGNGGNGGGSDGGGGGTARASCSFAGNAVTASGLPTDAVVNFMVTTSAGTSGWVLGYTPDGTWTVGVQTPSGPTMYEFVSRTYGPHGSKYDVYATCSA